jgi:dihydroorotase
LHITGVSTRRGIELIKEARKAGLRISCSITPNHCYFCDEDLAAYDTNLKMNPPLRSTDDRLALREALLAGDIDAIASHHMPQHWDDKTCEFEYAKNGAISLQTVFGVMNNLGMPLDQLISMLTISPRKIVGMNIPEIKIDDFACITLFNPESIYTFEESMIRSLSQNSPFIGKSMKGTVVGIIHKNQTIIHS